MTENFLCRNKSRCNTRCYSLIGKKQKDYCSRKATSYNAFINKNLCYQHHRIISDSHSNIKNKLRTVFPICLSDIIECYLGIDGYTFKLSNCANTIRYYLNTVENTPKKDNKILIAQQMFNCLLTNCEVFLDLKKYKRFISVMFNKVKEYIDIPCFKQFGYDIINKLKIKYNLDRDEIDSLFPNIKGITFE